MHSPCKFLILRSALFARISKDEATESVAAWFETALSRLLTMRTDVPGLRRPHYHISCSARTVMPRSPAAPSPQA
jgi:hypothetical protein